MTMGEFGRSTTDLEQLERLAHDFLLAYQTGDAGALGRLSTNLGREVTWNSLRQELQQRVRHLRSRPEGGDLDLSDINCCSHDHQAAKPGSSSWTR